MTPLLLVTSYKNKKAESPTYGTISAGWLFGQLVGWPLAGLRFIYL